MKSPQTSSSCPRLSRASTSCRPSKNKDVDGRDKPGHDDWAKLALIIPVIVPQTSAAFAHDSTVPHIHPHGFSVLPDYAAMLLGAALVAGGMIVYRMWRRG